MNAGFDHKTAIKQISEAEGFKVSKIQALAGGSINEVFLLHSTWGDLVCKLNMAAQYPGMFKAEKEGLEVLKESGTFRVPEVVSEGKAANFSYLLLEHIPKGQKDFSFWRTFAEDLASLHRNTAPAFGFPSPNYIGSLPQYNDNRDSAAEFYLSQRLEPQLKMAFDRGFEFGDLEKTFKNIADAIPGEPAALIHGDLWSGNYLVTEESRPCLIDPAVSFAPREMDLAMMKLFGGFPDEVFSIYSESFPLPADFPERVPLWQLYYLLVHLNIFGDSYFFPVKDILEKYS